MKCYNNEPITHLARLSRRSWLRAAGVAMAAGVTRARSARAASTVTVWWTQGYYEPEDQAVRDAMAAWERKSGNKVNLQIINAPDLLTKMIAALSVGDVPDLVQPVGGNSFLMPQAVWNGQMLDLSDVVETQKANYLPSALASCSYYDNTIKKRSYYGVPIKAGTLMEMAWRPMIEAAGFSDADIPKTQDAYFHFFETVQDRLRAKGKRIFGLGYSMATKENDSNNLFNSFLIAYGGAGIVTPEGQLRIDDPVIRKAAMTALERLVTPYKKGYVPPGSINWGDPDNNNAFFARQVAMTPNATISIAVAQMDKKDQYYKEIITHPVPLGNDGQPVPSILGVTPAVIPKAAKNIDAAKDLLRFFIQPDNLNAYLKQTLGRWTPVMPGVLKTDPYWMDPSDPHRPVAMRQGLITPTIAAWATMNPAYAQVISEQIWTQAEANITQRGMTVEQATDEAVRRIKIIFQKFEIA